MVTVPSPVRRERARSGSALGHDNVILRSGCMQTYYQSQSVHPDILKSEVRIPVTTVDNQKTQHMMVMAGLCATGWRSDEGVNA